MALSRLLDLLPAVTEVVTDENRDGPFATYLRCLSDPPPGTTHLCITQDDALPCGNFEERLEEAVANRPADMISLFVGDLGRVLRKNYYEAMNRQEKWCQLPVNARVHHVVALVWPVRAADDFLAWYPANELKIPARRPHRSDDMVISYWLKTSRPRRYLWATVPCLVEHPDDVPDVAHGGKRWSNGKDKGRRAIWFQN